MKNLSDKEKAQSILNENLYLTISVSDAKSSPWIANLYYAHDKNFNIYWYSSKETKHSKIIKKNPKVAFSIFDSHATGDDVDAVYIEALAKEITNKKELIEGLTAYGKKMIRTKFLNSKLAFDKFVSQITHFQGNSPLRMYKAQPVSIWKLAPSKVYKEKYLDSRIPIEIN